MSSKKIFCVTSYCNSEEKLNVLHKNLLHLKQYDYSILLHSYLPVPEYITKLVDYLIIDKDNPVIDKSIKALWWFAIFDNFQLNKMWDDTSWCAVNQIQQISSFLADKEFEYHIFLNYDLIMSPDKFQEWLIHQDKSFSGSTLSGDYNRSSLLFFILDKEDLIFFSKNISLSDYLSEKNGRMVEDYFHDKIIERKISFNPTIRFSDYIQGFFGNIPQDQVFNCLYDKTDDFHLFFDEKYIILYKPKVDCIIKIIANGITYNIDLKAGTERILEFQTNLDSFYIKYQQIETLILTPKDSHNEIKIL